MNTKELGKIGEQATIQLLQRNPQNTIEDVSGNPDFWAKDIDFVVHSNQKTTTIESKADTLVDKTGNLFLEIYCPYGHRADGKGWYLYTEAIWLFYFAITSKTMYCVRMDELRQLTDLNKYKTVHGGDNGLARGLLVPVKDVMQLTHSRMVVEAAEKPQEATEDTQGGIYTQR